MLDHKKITAKYLAGLSDDELIDLRTNINEDIANIAAQIDNAKAIF